MELKVWVDGIQRVVCGASYSTTCQDVVVALASAMGRTGRFTLVEKWRDSERPLFPNEYPLQSLHKWGEYAGEIRFYLVQAEADAAKQNETSQQKLKTQTDTFRNFRNNFSPSESSWHHLKPTEAESLKRSSTFSCAQRTNYAALPSSFSASSHKSATSSHYTNNQQTSAPKTISSAWGYPSGLLAVPNGKVAALSSSSSSDSSPRSSSKSLNYHPQNSILRGSLSTLHQITSAREDARQLHPANMPKALSSYSIQSADSSDSPSFRQYSSHQPANAPSQKRPPPTQLPYQTSSQHHIALATELASQSCQPQSQQPSLPSYPAHHQSRQSQQLHHVKPDPRPPLPSSSVEYNNIPPHPRYHQEPSRQRERPHYRNSRETKSIATSSGPQGPSRPFHIDDSKPNPAQETVIDASNSGHLHDGILRDAAQGIARADQHVQSKNIPQNVWNSWNSSSTQERSQPKDIFEPDKKSATLDRRSPRSKVKKELPNRSLSTGNHGDEQIENSIESKSNDLHPGFDMNQHRQGGEGNKLSFVDSALIRHQKTSTDDYAPKTSSFFSAVAYVRNHGDAYLKTPNADIHEGQHISDQGKEHGSYEKETIQNVQIPSQGTYMLGKEINSTVLNSHQQHTHYPGQSDTKPSVPFNLTSSARHNSAFTEVSPKAGLQETYVPSSPEPVAYSLDDLGASNESHQRQDSQTSVEFEEYDLDHSFPDVLHHRDAANSGRAKGDDKPRMLLEQHLELGVTSNQAVGERFQLLRTVHMQQESMKTQEAQINDASMEIAVLEEEESKEMTKLEVLEAEISQLEKQEAKFEVELEDLERTVWIHVLDGEQKKELNVKLQMAELKEKQEHIESQIRQLNKEVEQQSKELKVEQERIDEERRNNEELERQTLLEIAQLKDQLTDLNIVIDERNKKLKDVEEQILETDADLRQKEEKVNAIEEELRKEVPEDVQASPLPKEPSSNCVTAVAPSPVSALSTSDNGEAILKILEGQLSPHPSSFSAGDGGDNLGGVTSAQHLYKSAMAVKNPNGVWV